MSITGNQTKITYTEAARRQPRMRADKPCHPATIARWAMNGVTVCGQRIKLEVTQHGGRPCTTVEALDRFHARCEAARSGVAPEYAPVPSRGQADAELILDAAGV